MNKKIVVIYHRADFDGLFCREIARKFLGETAEYIGWDYGDEPPKVPLDCTLYLLDISIDGTLMQHPGLIWIDHHKSAIEKWAPDILTNPPAGYRIDGVAACRLALQWFKSMPEFATPNFAGRGVDETLPSKQAFIKREVSEPLAVRLAGEYDIWDKRDPRAELLQHGLRSCDLTNWWPSLLDDRIEAQAAVAELLSRGEALQYSSQRSNESIIKEIGFTIEFEGLKFLACNHARYNSFLFTAGLTPEHDACFGFKFDGQKRNWSVSLYHAPGKEHHDLSLIATKYGGGGHRGACGFRTDKLPFL